MWSVFTQCKLFRLEYAVPRVKIFNSMLGNIGSRLQLLQTNFILDLVVVCAQKSSYNTKMGR